MPVDIKNVLVCDAVDESCIQLLKQNGIKVIQKILSIAFLSPNLYMQSNNYSSTDHSEARHTLFARIQDDWTKTKIWNQPVLSMHIHAIWIIEALEIFFGCAKLLFLLLLLLLLHNMNVLKKLSAFCTCAI